MLALVAATNALSHCGAWLTTSNAHACTCWLICAVVFGNEMNNSPIPSPVTLLVASSSVAVIVSALVALAPGTFTHVTMLGLFGGTPNSITRALTKSSPAAGVVVVAVVAGADVVVSGVVNGSPPSDASSSSVVEAMRKFVPVAANETNSSGTSTQC